MYKQILITTSLAVGLISQTSIAKPVDRLEEKRPILTAHLKADARQHPVAYRQAREDALNNPGKTRNWLMPPASIRLQQLMSTRKQGPILMRQ